jgi:hypothetical protein
LSLALTGATIFALELALALGTITVTRVGLGIGNASRQERADHNGHGKKQVFTVKSCRFHDVSPSAYADFQVDELSERFNAGMAVLLQRPVSECKIYSATRIT